MNHGGKDGLATGFTYAGDIEIDLLGVFLDQHLELVIVQLSV